MRLNSKVREGDEFIKCVDVMVLYSYVCKYFKFPVGHPVIHVGDACQDRKPMLERGIDKMFHHTTQEILLSSVTFPLF